LRFAELIFGPPTFGNNRLLISTASPPGALVDLGKAEDFSFQRKQCVDLEKSEKLTLNPVKKLEYNPVVEVWSPGHLS
jgi:hypothetical protein